MRRLNTKSSETSRTDAADEALTQRIVAARERAESLPCESCGIGTLSEKLLHKAMKLYEEPRAEKHEIPILGSVADIFNEDGITEIQTHSLEKLIPKLRRFLPQYRVTVVHPLINSVNIRYIDTDSGELVSSRRSPRHDVINRVACELYKLVEFIPSPNFRAKAIFINFDDIRDKNGKKLNTGVCVGAFGRVPVSVSSEILFEQRSDYRILLPNGLGKVFTAAELSRFIGLDSRRTHNTISLLLSLGIIVREGKQGRAYIYRITEE